MRKRTLALLTLVTLALAGCLLVGVWSFTDSPTTKNYQRVRVGMSLDEVEAILGPGRPIPQSQVPGHVRAVNPDDERAEIDEAKRAGRSPPTHRGNYPTHVVPVVEGDTVLEWVTPGSGERILLGFRGGKVSGRYYFDPNFL